jgi:type VI secretion system protein ImpG
VALTLLSFARTQLTTLELRASAAVLPLRNSVRAWGLCADEPLLPPERFEHPGLRLVREYFLLPAKLAFIELDLPREAAAAPGAFDAATELTLRFRFDAQLPATMHVTRENVRVNCVPVVNVFQTTTDPVRPTLERPGHQLRPAGLPPGHGETYSVERVLARVVGQPGMAPVAPFTDFEAAPPGSLPGAVYVARPEPRARTTGQGTEMHLSVGTAVDSGILPEIEHLSVEIRASNGSLTSSLGVGDVCVPTATSPRGLAFRNVTAVTPHRPAATGDELRWRTLASTALTALPLTDPRTLKTLLHLLDLHPLADAQAARAHAQRLDAILEVTQAPARARYVSASGAITRVSGYDVRVVLGKDGGAGDGDALLFASVLARLFAHEASLNGFVRTTARVAETGKVFAFPALHGDEELEGEA